MVGPSVFYYVSLMCYAYAKNEPDITLVHSFLNVAGRVANCKKNADRLGLKKISCRRYTRRRKNYYLIVMPAPDYHGQFNSICAASDKCFTAVSFSGDFVLLRMLAMMFAFCTLWWFSFGNNTCVKPRLAASLALGSG